LRFLAVLTSCEASLDRETSLKDEYPRWPQRVMVGHIKREHNSSANEGLAVVARPLSLTDTILRRSISAFGGKADVLGGGFVWD
jgi:hypothetical protein